MLLVEQSFRNPRAPWRKREIGATSTWSRLWSAGSLSCECQYPFTLSSLELYIYTTIVVLSSIDMSVCFSIQSISRSVRTRQWVLSSSYDLDVSNLVYLVLSLYETLPLIWYSLRHIFILSISKNLTWKICGRFFVMISAIISEVGT